MNHEINENFKGNQPEEKNSGESLFLKIHDTKPSHEEIAKRLDANNLAIQEQMERIAHIAMRANALQGCSEPHHFQTLKDLAANGAAAGEPAYKALHKHLT